MFPIGYYIVSYSFSNSSFIASSSFEISLCFSILKLTRVQLMYALRTYINKSVFGKILLEIEKNIKTFSNPDKTFSKNGILLCDLRTHVTKIQLTNR